MTDIPREDWTAALSAVPDGALKAVVASMPRTWRVTPTALPQSGLGLLKMQDSALGDVFYLGEFPLSVCRITVHADGGRKAEGAALVMDDSVERAEWLAVCDALLAERLPGWEAVDALLQQGVEARARIVRERKALLARTRVDFSLLDDVGDDDD